MKLSKSKGCRFLSLFFGKQEKRRSSRLQSLERCLRRAVARTACENLNLQRGMFISGEDIEKLRRKNLAHDFTKSK
jgi:hypothetical protein